ncbi:myosin-I binding protein [Pelomyxa schiedti]|nr:myosin-I binding protein [Pelomyxa schiedti]
MADPQTTMVEQIMGNSEQCLYTGVLNVRTTKRVEQKQLALSKFFVYLIGPAPLTPKSKVLHQVHFLDIKEVRSNSRTEIGFTFKNSATAIAGEVEDADECLNTLLTQVKYSFPGVSEPLFSVVVVPDSRMPSVPDKDTICGGFIPTYESICKHLDVPFRADICWDMEHLVTRQKLEKFNVNEFETPTPNDIRAMMHTLKYNNYFKGLEAPDFPLGKDKSQIDAVFECLKVNTKIECLDLSNVGARPEHIVTLSTVLLANKAMSLTELNLSGNPIEASGVAALCKYLEAAPHGIVTLNLDGCKIDAKGFQLLGAALRNNPKMASSLTYLNLSHNKIEPEGSVGICSFIASPNTIRTLQIKETISNLETISGAVVRGCPELRMLDLSGNRITPRTVPSLVKWIGSSSNLEVLNLSGTSIQPDGIKEILSSIAQNVYLKAVTVKAKSNALGIPGATAIASVASSLKNIHALDLADNDFQDDGVIAIAHAFCESEALGCLNLDANLSARSKRGNTLAFDALIELVESECPLEVLSLCGSKTMQPKTDDLLSFIYAVGVNESLLELNVSGNGMGNKGAIALGKALQTNKTLRMLSWDDNGVTYPGFIGFKVGLERNRSLKTMPMPILDIAACMREAQGPVLTKLHKLVIEMESCIYRNQNPSSRFEGTKGYQMSSLLLTSGQQAYVEAELLKIKRMDPNRLCETEQFRPVLEDAAKAEKVTTSFHLLRESMQASMEVELRKTLQGFAEQAAKFVMDSKVKMRTEIFSILGQNFESFDGETFRPLKTAIDYGSKGFDNSTLDQILVNAAGAEIMNKASECFISTVEVATDYVYEKIMNSLFSVEEDLVAKQQEEEEELPPPPSNPPPTPGREDSGALKPVTSTVKKPSSAALTETPATSTTSSKMDPAKKPSSLASKAAMFEQPAAKPDPPVAARAASRPAPGRLAANTALAAAIGRGGIGAPPPRRGATGAAAPAAEPAEAETSPPPAMSAASTSSASTSAAAPVAPRKVKTRDASSVLAQADSGEPTGPALQHVTKTRAKPAGARARKGGKPGRRPPSRRPVNRSADGSS